MNTAPCNDPTLGRPLGVYTLYREMPRHKAHNGLEVMQKAYYNLQDYFRGCRKLGRSAYLRLFSGTQGLTSFLTSQSPDAKNISTSH